MRIIKHRAIDRNWGVRYVAKEMAKQQDKMETVYTKIQSNQALDIEETWRLRQFMLDTKIMSTMLTADVAKLDAEVAASKRNLIERLKFAFKG